MKRLFFSFTFPAFLPLQALAQGMSQNAGKSLAANDKIWVVVLVLATIFLGIIAFMIYLDRKLQRMEKRIKQKIIS